MSDTPPATPDSPATSNLPAASTAPAPNPPATSNVQVSPSGFRPIPKYVRWLAFGGAMLLIAMLVAMYIGLTRVVIGEHETKVQWLPAAAVDASYYRSYPYTAFEFSITEEGFLAWAKSNQWEVKPLEKPATIGRYTAGPKYTRKDADPEKHEVKHGYIMERLAKPGTEEGIRVLYDSDNSRAYYTWRPST